MKKVVLIVSTLLFCCSASYGQNFFKEAGKSVLDIAKKSVQKTVEEVVDSVATKAVNTAADAATKAASKVKGAIGTGVAAVEGTVAKADSTVNATVAAVDSTAQGVVAKADSVKTEVTGAVSSAVSPVANLLNPDFTAGTEVVFEDTLEGEKTGEFPSQWDLLTGEAVVADLDGTGAISFASSDTKIVPILDAAIGESYTAEADIWFAGTGKDQSYVFEFLQADKKVAYTLTVNAGAEKGTVFEAKWYAPGDDEPRNSKTTVSSDKCVVEGWNHLALSFDKKSLKVYLDTERVANVPNCVQAANLRINNGAQSTPSYIRNVRIANVAAK